MTTKQKQELRERIEDKFPDIYKAEGSAWPIYYKGTIYDDILDFILIEIEKAGSLDN